MGFSLICVSTGPGERYNIEDRHGQLPQEAKWRFRSPLAEAREYREAITTDIFGPRLVVLAVVGGQGMILCSVEWMQRMGRFTLVPTTNISVRIPANGTEENR